MIKNMFCFCKCGFLFLLLDSPGRPTVNHPSNAIEVSVEKNDICPTGRQKGRQTCTRHFRRDSE